MTIKEYDLVPDGTLECYRCKSDTDVTIDEDGDAICMICLSGMKCEEDTNE